MVADCTASASAPVSVFSPRDLVRVRDEDVPSVVVLPTDRPAEPGEVPVDVPDLGPECCVPVVLVRTPALTAGDLRWVLLEDVGLAEDLMRDAEAVEVGMWVQRTDKPPGYWLRVGAVSRVGPDSPVVLYLNWGCCDRIQLRLEPGQQVFALDASPVLMGPARGSTPGPS